MDPEGTVAADLPSAAILCEDGLSNPLEIRLSCANLVNLDTSSYSDPFAVVYVENKG